MNTPGGHGRLRDQVARLSQSLRHRFLGQTWQPQESASDTSA